LAEQAELRLALTCLQDFAGQVEQGLEHADWQTQRAVIRALVKRVEVTAQEIRIVYRVAPVPFVESPSGGVLQHCPTRLRVLHTHPDADNAAMSPLHEGWLNQAGRKRNLLS
jgi:hypothetical protein